MDPQFVLIPVMAAAGLVQAVSGFGSALVAMPILAQLFGTRTATPMFAIAAIVGEVIMIVKYRHNVTVAPVWRLALAAIVGIPIGIFGSPYVDERLMLLALGIMVFGFALYSLLTPRIPRLANPRWGYAFGFVAGLFSGAFNTGGPPYVMYGTTQGWTPRTFKANLQGVFIIGSVTILAGHALRGNFTPNVIGLALIAVPAFLVGIFGGGMLDRYINPVKFRRGVLFMLLVISLTLIF